VKPGIISEEHSQCVWISCGL